MAVSSSLKRKADDPATSTPSQKKRACKGATDESDNGSSFSNDDEDYVPRDGSLDLDPVDNAAVDNQNDPKAVLTKTGTARAASEANRLWNYVCTYEGCSARYNRPCRLEMHLRTHKNERPWACTFEGCDKRFPRKEHMTRHFDSTHKNIRKYKCDWESCDKEFATAAHLKRHKKSHEKQEVFRCRDHPPCSETFRKKATLDAHIKTKHLDMKAYACSLIDETTGLPCTAAYNRESALRMHVGRFHSGNRYSCTICSPNEEVNSQDGFMSPAEPVGFPTYSALQAHMAEVHPPTCTMCHKQFASAATLKAHIEISHEGPSRGTHNFRCTEPGCDRTFTKRGNLNVHVQSVHQKVKRFICGEVDLSKSSIPQVKNWDRAGGCGQSFGAKSSLEQHVQTQHLGQKLNRKHIRQAKKQEKKKAAPSAASLLTGFGYGGDRDVACVVSGCPYRFFRNYELRVHLRGAPHHFSDEQIDEMILDRDDTYEPEESYGLDGVEWWVRGANDVLNEQQPNPLDLDFDPRIDPALHKGNAYGQDVGFDQNPQGHGRSGYITPFESNMSMNGDEAELDKEMGIEELPSVNVHEGNVWNRGF